MPHVLLAYSIALPKVLLKHIFCFHSAGEFVWEATLAFAWPMEILHLKKNHHLGFISKAQALQSASTAAMF